MTNRHHSDVCGGPADLGRLLAAVEAFAERHRIPSPVRREIRLALDEALSNVIRHGYRGCGPYRIGVELALQRGVLQIDVTDDARPFNPLERPDPRMDVSPSERPVGGLGVYLVRRLMDEVEYWRNDLNHLVLRRVIEPRPRSGRRDGRTTRSERGRHR